MPGQYAADPERPIRLMIVDDSPVARAVLSRMLSPYKEFEVVALAGDAAEAIEALGSVKLDIVLLDVEMPGTNGLQALPTILELGRGARVLIVSSLCETGAEATVKALALGAADTLPKPGAVNFEDRFSEVLADRLRRIGRSAPPEMISTAADEPPISVRAASEQRLGCLAMGASTGGLHAIMELLKTLPAMIGAPLLVTQHLPAVFMPHFGHQLEAASGRKVHIARDGLVLRAEEIILAPGDAHLGLERDGARVRVKLDTTPVASGCMPSVDVMLHAVASLYGPSAIGVVLSGMGRDGLAGSRRIIDRGGSVLVQDRQSSAVWGMPRVIAEAGLATAVLPPGQLAHQIAARVHGGAWK
jgi:two-component system, chemotaxis family, protein-glutamate methylesterase/glutaminase